MSDDGANLPPELRELEAALAARPMPEAGSSHRGQVLSAMRRELAARKAPRSIWQFAAAAAAMLLLGINLSMSAANDTSVRLSARNDARQMKVAYAQLREALPEISEAEAQRQIILWQARSQLINTPQVIGGAHTLTSMEGL